MGHHNIHFDGDQYSSRGAWGPPTSRANFCEEDYSVTFQIAELINSVTNLAYVYFALRYMYGSGSHGLAKPNLDFMSVTLLTLGISSFLFHASLRQTLEFVDECSMLGLTWSMVQETLSIRQSRSKIRKIRTDLTFCFVSFAIFYVRSPKILVQVIAFVAGLLAAVLRTQYLFHLAEPAFPKEKSRDWNARTWKAISICLIGYFLWNLDLEYCELLKEVRKSVGQPWAWLFELHGWWHVLTAVGASQFMDVAREIRAEVEREKRDGEFDSEEDDDKEPEMKKDKDRR